MATATRSAKTSKKRALSRKQGLESPISKRDRAYPEAPEAPQEILEQPEASYELETEAPDAGERRCDPSEEYFTHGRSWS